MKKINFNSYSATTVALSLCLALSNNFATADATCEFSYSEAYIPATPDAYTLGGRNSSIQQCSTYNLTFEEEATSAGAKLVLNYHEQIGEVTINMLEDPDFQNHFYFLLRLNSYLIDSKNDQPKKFIFNIQEPKASENSFEDYQTNEWQSKPTWHGDIIHRGQATLVFKPKITRSSEVQFKAIKFVWKLPAQPDQIDPAHYVGASKYSFKNPYQNSRFNVAITPPEGRFVIGKNSELSIHSGVTLWMNGILQFEPATATDIASKPGILSYHLSSTDNLTCVSKLPEADRALLRSTIAKGMLVVNSTQNRLDLRKLQLNIRYEDNNFYDELSNGKELKLISIAEGRATKICFADKPELQRCLDTKEPLRYRVINDFGKPDLEVIISAERNTMTLKKLDGPAPQELITDNPALDAPERTEKPPLITVSNPEIGHYKVRPRNSAVPCEAESPTPEQQHDLQHDQQITSQKIASERTAATQTTITVASALETFRKNLLIASLRETVSDLSPDDMLTTDATGRRMFGARTSGASLVPMFGADTTLSIAANTQLHRAETKNYQAQSQSYKLLVGGQYYQFAGNLNGIYIRLVSEGDTNHLMSGLAQVSYLTPVKGLNASLYLGGGLTPAKSIKYRVVTTGLMLNYQHRFEKNFGITFVPDLRLDLTALFTNINNTTDKDIYLLGQTSLRLGIDTANLLGNYQLQLSIPLKLAVNGRLQLNEPEEKSYEFSVAAGLDLQFVAWQNLVMQIGYGFRYGQSYSKQSLNLQFRFRM